MQTKIKTVAVTALLLASVTTGAMAQYACPPGYVFYAGVCQPSAPPGYSNPVSGAVQGEASGAAAGYSAAGRLGAVVGGALGTASGTLSGTAGMLAPPAAPPPACPYGYSFYNGACYPVR